MLPEPDSPDPYWVVKPLGPVPDNCLLFRGYYLQLSDGEERKYEHLSEEVELSVKTIIYTSNDLFNKDGKTMSAKHCKAITNLVANTIHIESI